MSSATSAVTYTSVYTDSTPGRVFWGADEEISNGGPPRVIVYGYDGLPMQLVAPPSPDYVPEPEHLPSPDYVPGPEHPPSPIEIPYVPEPEYPEYLVPSEDEAPMEDQPLPADAPPAALSPGYVPDSDPEEDPEEDSEEHPDYPADGGDGDDEPSDDDSDDDNDDDEEPFEDEEDDDEEEEHLAPADSSAAPIADPVPSARDTEAFETDESAPTPRAPQTIVPFAQTRLRRAQKTVRPQPPMSASMKARIAEHAAAPTPLLPVASPPLPLPSPLTTSPTDAGAPLGYRAAGIRMRAAATSPPSLLPSTSHRTDVPEAEMPPWKRACITTPALGCEIGESSAAGAARRPGPTPERTKEFQVRFEEAYDDRAYLNARVNTLFRDRPYHRHTALALDREAKMPPKRTTRTTPATTTTPTTTVTNAQLQALNQQGVQLLFDKYYPRGEIKKLESEYWNLKNVPKRNQLKWKDMSCRPDLIHGSVKAPKPQSIQEAIEFATEMMDKKMLTVVERQAENKRKFEDTSRNNQNQQQPFKRNNVARAYTAVLRKKA
ncbi:hypothetical protein Tco_0682732, partial [Tanacetum coccineum]